MDKYTKLAKIGKGSFGCAYLAVRKSDPSGKKLVIKEIRMDPRDQQSALREAKLLAALDHPNIIACKESFLLAPPPPVASSALGGVAVRLPPPAQVLCIVTEYADGGDLRKKLERGSRMRESEMLDLFVQICLALKHLHDRKIIHRDIKPENVFLMHSNVVKLGDFGVATVLSHTLASAETLTGTPYYTSPEICLGRRYNHKTDVWSLGCVLFELATLTHAFDGRSQRQLFDNIVSASAPPMPPSAAVSPRFAELVVEMLRKNPRDRPSVNQIIKKPIVMERIQGFLTQRALADELNHTVLHGHHIFRDRSSAAAGGRAPPAPSPGKRAGADSKSPSPNPVAAAPNNVVRRADAGDRSKRPAVPAATPRKVKLGAIGAAGSGRSPGVLLKKSRSFKKAAAVAASPTPSRAVRAAPTAAPSPTRALQEQRSRLLLQKKRAVVERAKQEAMRVRLVAPPPPPAAAKGPSAAVAASSKNAQVADRVSAFNAQWRAQRQQLLQNLPCPPSPPSSQPNTVGAVLPPPAPAPAVIAVEAKKVSEYPKPVVTAPPAPVLAPPPAPMSARRKTPAGAAVVKAAAAKQRDAMRRDILSRKQELKRAGGARASASGCSPLDDPVILVQNLPDYAVVEPPASEAAVAPADASDSEEDADDAAPPANLEYERMVLQLKSVVESSDLDDEPSDDESEDRDAAACAPLPPAYNTAAPPPPLKPTSLSTLERSTLEDPRFIASLRALLSPASAPTGTDHVAILASESSAERREALVWMRDYVSALTSTPDGAQ